MNANEFMNNKYEIINNHGIIHNIENKENVFGGMK